MRCVFISFIVCVFNSAGYCQAQDTSTELKALYSIYDFQFEKYHNQLRVLPADETSLAQLLEIFFFRWKEIPVAYSTASSQYQQLLLKNLSALLKEKEPTPSTIYYQICTCLFLAEYYSSLNENWSALKYAQKAYPLVIASLDKKTNQPEFLFINGLYLYYIEYYREKNLFYRVALSPLRKGNKEEGLKILNQCLEKKSMIQIEAKLYLAHILLHLEKKTDEALPISQSLAICFPKNLKFAELYAENLIAVKKYAEANKFVSILETQRSPYYSIPGHVLRGLIEEDYLNNKNKAKEAYLFSTRQELKPVEYFQKIALQRLKNE
ncbi:MAG: hypothetical protein JST69_04615 [Bacteroidetes bacterium]|nr:hypothetical protein [Bacteroidota bacterium]